MNEAIQQQETQGNGVLPSNVTTSTFERTWKNARLDPPKEGGRYDLSCICY